MMDAGLRRLAALVGALGRAGWAMSPSGHPLSPAPSHRDCGSRGARGDTGAFPWTGRPWLPMPTGSVGLGKPPCQQCSPASNL